MQRSASPNVDQLLHGHPYSDDYARGELEARLAIGINELCDYETCPLLFPTWTAPPKGEIYLGNGVRASSKREGK
eukprot:5919317-Pyramimonas_sp.AAC.1